MLPRSLTPRKTIYVYYLSNSASTIPHDLRIAISQARNAKGWTQEEFAKHCSIPKQDINHWEAGKSVPTGQNIVTMEGVLGVKLPRPPKHH